MLLTTNSSLCNVSLASQFNMSQPGTPRSHSPLRGEDTKKGEDTKSLTDQILEQLGPKLDKANADFMDATKSVVGSLVNQQIERLEKKIADNQQATQKQIADNQAAAQKQFADLETNLLKAIKASNSPPAPAPAPTGGSPEVHPGLRPTPGGRSFAEAAGAPGQQPVVNAVTTPAFNRKPNPTKLFCNLHDRAKVPKKKS